MGFRDIQLFNLAILAKQGWCLLKEKDSLLYGCFKAKYFPCCSFLKAKDVPKNSYMSSSFHMLNNYPSSCSKTGNTVNPEMRLSMPPIAIGSDAGKTNYNRYVTTANRLQVFVVFGIMASRRRKDDSNLYIGISATHPDTLGYKANLTPYKRIQSLDSMKNRRHTGAFQYALCRLHSHS